MSEGKQTLIWVVNTVCCWTIILLALKHIPDTSLDGGFISTAALVLWTVAAPEIKK